MYIKYSRSQKTLHPNAFPPIGCQLSHREQINSDGQCPVLLSSGKQRSPHLNIVN